MQGMKGDDTSHDNFYEKIVKKNFRFSKNMSYFIYLLDSYQ